LVHLKQKAARFAQYGGNRAAARNGVMFPAQSLKGKINSCGAAA
jgi:hypothetical protein